MPRNLATGYKMPYSGALALYDKLAITVDEIFDKKTPRYTFEDLYSSISKIVLNSHEECIYLNFEETLLAKIHGTQQKLSLLGDGIPLLRSLNEYWNNYKNAMSKIIPLLLPYDRSAWLRKRKFPTSFDMSRQLFKRIILVDTGYGEKIKQQLLSFVKQERLGNPIDKILFRETTQTLHDLSSYEEFFETEFLVQSKEFYVTFAKEVLSVDTKLGEGGIQIMINLQDFLNKVHGKLVQEGHLVDSCLQEQTRPKIQSIISDQLVTDNINFILENSSGGFESLVKNDSYDDLRRIYELFDIHQDHLLLLRDIFKSLCLEYFKRHVGDHGNALTRPLEYIQGLFDLKTKFDVIIDKSFKGNIDFSKALYEAAQTSVTFGRFSEYLAKFLDSLIRNMKSFDRKLEENMERGLLFFRMLSDKDVFENNYKIELSKRLLMPKEDFAVTSSLEPEIFFLNKLKAEQGRAFTYKMSGMIKDIMNTGELDKLFKESKYFKEYLQSQQITQTTSIDVASATDKETQRISSSNSVDVVGTNGKQVQVSVYVLTTLFWPSFIDQPVKLPQDMQSIVDCYGKIYGEKWEGRKLTWMMNMGYGAVDGLFPLGKFELHMMTSQLIVLLTINENLEVTMSTLLEKTGMPEKDLKKSLQLLYGGRYRVLSKTGDQREIADTDIFTVNPLFKAERSSVRIQAPLLPAQQTSNYSNAAGSSALLNPSDNNVVGSSSLTKSGYEYTQIDYSIMKTLKAKGKLTITQLQTDSIVDMLGNQVKVDPQLIRRRIEEMLVSEILFKNENDLLSLSSK